MNSRTVKSICAIVLCISFFCSQLVFAMEPSINILGDVVGSGNAEMKAAFNKWISISGKTYPVIDGASLRSADGMMSLIFRDAARMEVGKNSEILLAGSRGNYSISVNIGQIAFSVPQGISFSVKTPTSIIQTKASTGLIQKVSLSSQQSDVRGIVTYDGKGTRITAVNGTLTVKSGIGVQLQTVTAGNALYVEGKDTGKILPTQTFKNSTTTNNAGDSTALWVAGGGIAFVAGMYGITRLVSPWR